MAETPRIITETADLVAFCTDMAAESVITVDTEFMRERTYYPQLCLIQVAGETQAAVIDVQSAGLDLGCFWNLLRNQNVLKVLHAPRQDIEIFVHLGGVIPQPLFDTQIAAMALGFPDQVSYAKLAESLVNVIINKEEQFTDWTIRPLRPAQLIYALQDVTVLRDVYRVMQKKLVALDRTAWVMDDMARLNNMGTYRIDPDTTWERLKLRSNKPSSWAALRALAAWREREAVRLNRPRQMVLKDDVLSQLALTVPITREQLSRTRGLPNSLQKDAVAEQIIALMQTAKRAGVDALPPRGPNNTLTPAQEDHLDLLRLALKIIARQQQVTPRLLAGTDDLSDLILGRDTPLNHGWRAEIFGTPAKRLLNGDMAITVAGLVVV